MMAHPVLFFLFMLVLVGPQWLDEYRAIWRDWRAQRARRLASRPDTGGWTKPQMAVLYSSVALSLLFFHLLHQ